MIDPYWPILTDDCVTAVLPVSSEMNISRKFFICHVLISVSSLDFFDHGIMVELVDIQTFNFFDQNFHFKPSLHSLFVAHQRGHFHSLSCRTVCVQVFHLQRLSISFTALYSTLLEQVDSFKTPLIIMNTFSM